MKAGVALNKMRETMVLQGKSRRTIKTYLFWAKRLMAFIHLQPATATREENVIAFLTLLADKEHVASNTQKQALCAIVYLFKRALRLELGDISAFVRANRPRRLPEVFSREEATRALDQLSGVGWLWGALMYGCGLRLMEVYNLRVKDIDLDRRQLMVREGKGNKDRMLGLPEMLVEPLQKHLRTLQLLYDRYAAQRVPVSLPDALDRKYPNAPYEWRWFWLFPANGPVRERPDHYVDPLWIGKLHHIHETAIQKQIARAIRAAKITKRSGCHTFRHSYATHWLESAKGSQEIAILRLQKLLGHTRTATTMIYLHLVKQESDIPSPLDTLWTLSMA